MPELGVRVRRSHKDRVQGAVVIKVLDEATFTSEQAIVFYAVHDCSGFLG